MERRWTDAKTAAFLDKSPVSLLLVTFDLLPVKFRRRRTAKRAVREVDVGRGDDNGG